ncbi:myrosinase 1-like [Anticarsia gemmatalis]|uniref:myrosinase 1-like n=1 Tax=Anticarsia gemmatalis TaxID=129554 RepID=UPI003F7666C3
MSFGNKMYVSALVFCIVISVARCSGNLGFPPGFKLGVATASYQVEGAWNVSDKGESIWDRLLHTQPSLSADGSNGDVACDSYHLWRRDIEMAVELGVDMYRFSISWPRLLPSGFANYVSEDGKRYYNNLIDGLLEKGIEPVVTLYHWDLPQYLQDLGGWANPLIVDWFADYARVAYTLFGDRIKTWLTLNEPLIICDGGYNKLWAPYLDDLKVAAFLCNKNVMMAHAKAYRMYDEEFRPLYQGKVSFPNIFFWFEPETPADAEAAVLTRQMWHDRYAHPVFSQAGGWPPELEKVLLANGKREGYPYPRLPPFTQEEINYVKGTYDFYALNHYTTRLVRRVKPGEAGSWIFYGSEEINVAIVNDPSWTTAVTDWFAINPTGLRKQLHWINSTYGISDILITENGLPTFEKDLLDVNRITYIRSYLEQILLAINDGINVMGYTAWSLMDNFEWLAGYTVKYGLYDVDFTSPNRTRTPRESARYFSNLTKTRTLTDDNIYYLRNVTKNTKALKTLAIMEC